MLLLFDTDLNLFSPSVYVIERKIKEDNNNNTLISRLTTVAITLPFGSNWFLSCINPVVNLLAPTQRHPLIPIITDSIRKTRPSNNSTKVPIDIHWKINFWNIFLLYPDGHQELSVSSSLTYQAPEMRRWDGRRLAADQRPPTAPSSVAVPEMFSATQIISHSSSSSSIQRRLQVCQTIQMHFSDGSKDHPISFFPFFFALIIT